MDIYNIPQELKFINQIGVTLNIEEKLKLELALLKLSETEKFDQVKFWGKIEGVTRDYYVAIGLQFRGEFEFPVKKFFFAGSDCVFSQLPEIQPNDQHKDKVDTFRQLFKGQKEFPLITVVAEGEQQQEEQQNQDAQQAADSDEDAEIKIPPKNFTEQDRLSYVVRAIENDCALCPIGAYKLTPTHELRVNDSFKGLNLNNVSDLKNYQHFRAPQSKEKQEVIQRDDALFSFDFLDPVKEDKPKGCWSIQTDSSKSNTTIRSLLWPGFVAYHRANSNTYGYCYIGNGIKNADLPFLLSGIN